MLMTLRKTIKAAAPKATESISYGIVGYKQNGKQLVYFGYWKAHCALYGGGTGTIRFTADKPLPDRLVTKIVGRALAVAFGEVLRGVEPEVLGADQALVAA